MNECLQILTFQSFPGNKAGAGSKSDICRRSLSLSPHTFVCVRACVYLLLYAYHLSHASKNWKNKLCDSIFGYIQAFTHWKLALGHLVRDGAQGVTFVLLVVI